MKQNKSRLIMSLLSAGAFTVVLQLQLGRRINPIGWYDLNKDGVKDAIVMRKIDEDYQEIGFIDGNFIYKNYDNQFMTKEPFQKFNLPHINYNPGIIYNVMIKENQENSLTIHINARDKESKLESNIGTYEHLSLIRNFNYK